MRITKTSKQAQREKDKAPKHYLCPECQQPNFGVVVIKHVSRFFKAKMIRTHQYRCSDCGCEWEYDE